MTRKRILFAEKNVKKAEIDLGQRGMVRKCLVVDWWMDSDLVYLWCMVCGSYWCGDYSVFRAFDSEIER